MKKLKVGLIGTGFMGKAHSVAYATMPIFFYPAPAFPIKEIICSSNEERAKYAAEMFGFNRWTTKWEDIIADDSIDIVDISTANDLHKPIAIAAIKAGKHVLCEKPLARDGQEAKEMYNVSKNSSVKNMVAFNYRKAPAIAYSKQLIDEGKIGEIYHFRGFYLNDWAMDPSVPLSWRFQASKAGSGVLGDQGTHVIDIARYLVGDFNRVIAQTEIPIKERPVMTSKPTSFSDKIKPSDIEMKKVDVEDICALLIEFKNGVKGTLEASRVASGHFNYMSFEINGSKGSIYFNWERNNELFFYSALDDLPERGYRRLMMGPNHPRGNAFWPIAGENIGYSESTAIEIYDLISGIVESKEVLPDFYDGWRICEIVDSALKSLETGKWENCH